MAAGQSRGTVLPAPNFHAERAAIKLQKAMKGIGTDEKVIIEVLTTHSNNQRQEIKKKYKALYGRDLTEDLRAELGGHFEDVCLALLTPAEEYLAACLNKAIKFYSTPSLFISQENEKIKGPGTDEFCLIDILTTQKQNELELLTNIYKEKYSADLETDLKEDVSGSFKALVRSLLSGGREESPAEDEEKVHIDVQDLHDAVTKNDTQQFASILNTRSFDHLKQVFETYVKVVNKDIEEDVNDIFSGDAKNGYTSLVKVVKNEAEYFAQRLQSVIKGVGTDDPALIRIIVTHSESDLADIKDQFKALHNKELTEAVADDTSGDYRKILLKLIA